MQTCSRTVSYTHLTRAAVEEGIIAGGGSAYIHASKKVAELVDTLEGDEKMCIRDRPGTVREGMYMWTLGQSCISQGQ